MLPTATIVDVKFLSVCPPYDAVGWLKERRAEIGELDRLGLKDYSHQELALAARNDPYIDFGLARYGTSTEAGKIVYGRGGAAIRITFLAHFPWAGFSSIFDNFELADKAPASIEQLAATVANPSLSDRLFIQCFEKAGIFEKASEEEYQNILIAAADNPRLMTPYDDTFLDGYSDYSYHNVFQAAWQLTTTVPVTARWASVMYHFLYRCQLGHGGFDAKAAIARWKHKPETNENNKDVTYFLRSRLADHLEPSDELLNSQDGSLRESFYRRFSPWQYPKWHQFAKDADCFFDGAIRNDNLWRKKELREALGELCWGAPDPQASMERPNAFRGREVWVRREHPDWFADEE